MHFTQLDSRRWKLIGDGFTIGFISDVSDRETESMLRGIIDAAGGEVDEGYGPETALRGPNGIWYILRGDFRKDYEGLAPQGWDACLAFFMQMACDGYRSEWSTDILVDDIGMGGDIDE